MKLITLDNFAAKGSGQLPDAGFAYVTIASGSSLDLCLVGGRTLGVGGIVPWAPDVHAVRGARFKPELANGTTDATAPGTALQADQVNRLELALWTAHEVPQAGPRAPCLASGYIEEGKLEAAPTHDDIPTGTPPSHSRILVLPFAGRTRAAFYVKRTNATQDLSILVRGVRYLPPDLAAKRKAGTAAAVAEEFFDELVATLWNGAGACPASIATGLPRLGATFYVDNVDYDEVELYVYGVAIVGSGDVYATGEATGERCL